MYYGPPIKDLPVNIKTVTWAHQNDILGHPEIKAFISHCGMNSVLEAGYHGVPVVAVPLMYDQPNNAQKIALVGMAKVINFRQLNAKFIEKIVGDVTVHPKYAQTLLKYRPL